MKPKYFVKIISPLDEPNTFTLKEFRNLAEAKTYKKSIATSWEPEILVSIKQSNIED